MIALYERYSYDQSIKIECCSNCSNPLSFEYVCISLNKHELRQECPEFREFTDNLPKREEPEYFECMQCHGDRFIRYLGGERFCNVCLGRGYFDWITNTYHQTEKFPEGLDVTTIHVRPEDVDILIFD